MLITTTGELVNNSVRRLRGESAQMDGEFRR
jgi:hypothetical protein